MAWVSFTNVGERLVDIDAADLESEVGSTTYDRGRTYAKRGAVLNVLWDPAAHMLHGKVVGNGAIYSTSAELTSYDGALFRFNQGECSCPVGFDCKHVVALVLTVADGPPRSAIGTRPRNRPLQVAGTSSAPSWEQSLNALLAGAPTGARDDTTGTPLALELSVLPAARSGAVPRLLARLMRPGKTGGWVNGGLTWSGLDTAEYRPESPRPDHVRLLQELYALSAGPRTSYRYYGDAKTLDLSMFESAQLWPLLDRAAAAGVRLVHARKNLGDVRRNDAVELCLDLVGGTEREGLAMRPVLHLDGEPLDAEPVAFVGPGGHGVAYVDRDDLDGDHREWPLRLARLDQPVPPELQAAGRRPPATGDPGGRPDRFATDFYPRLRRLAPVVSSDESFSLPGSRRRRWC